MTEKAHLIHQFPVAVGVEGMEHRPRTTETLGFPCVQARPEPDGVLGQRSAQQVV